MWYNEHMEKMFDVSIIGGGMSGIILAINLKRQGLNVCIFEAKDRIGKKILASGNGKCNISNVNLDLSNYNNEFPRCAIETYGYEEQVAFYKSLGLILKEDQEGRIYPYSESANTVLNSFLEELNKLNTKVLVNTKIEKIEKDSTGYILKANGSTYKSKIVVLSSGSNASFGLNSHALFGQMGHNCTNLEQSLVPIKTSALRGCNGVRSKAKASLYINNKEVFSEKGELLFKDNAISGILAFKISAYIAREIVKTNNIDAYIEIDFMPDYTEDEINDFIDNSALAHPLTGLLHKAIALNFDDEENPAYAIKHYRCKVLGLMGLDNAQVTSGGLDVSQFNPNTMESLINKGLYAIGEVLDVDGQCGGYNLAFACSSALLASKDISSKLCK